MATKTPGRTRAGVGKTFKTTHRLNMKQPKIPYIRTIPARTQLDAVKKEYMRLAAALWLGTDPLSAVPMKDRDIFDLLGFD